MGSLFRQILGAADDAPIRSFGNGFWNVRVPFQVSLLEIGTHMSLVQLSNGNFLIIDTVAVNDQLKKEIDDLTNNGTKIEAVVAVHPFHTLAYSNFYKMYPNAKYYGTPRHLRILPEINWAGQLDNADNSALLSKWAPDVEFRIPAGVVSIPSKRNRSISSTFNYEFQVLNILILNLKTPIILSAFSPTTAIRKVYTSTIL